MLAGMRAPDGYFDRALGREKRVHDVTAISPGEDYTVAIDRALADSDAALVVIGPGWLTVTSPQGARRLFEPGDYVRLDSHILRRDIRAVPVLVGGARCRRLPSCPMTCRRWLSGRPWNCTTRPGARTSTD